MIDAAQVSKVTWVDLAESFSLGAREFYKNPANREAFRKWKEERKSSDKNNKKGDFECTRQF